MRQMFTHCQKSDAGLRAELSVLPDKIDGHGSEFRVKLALMNGGLRRCGGPRPAALLGSKVPLTGGEPAGGPAADQGVRPT
jgi:hypothetical protein